MTQTPRDSNSGPRGFGRYEGSEVETLVARALGPSFPLGALVKALGPEGERTERVRRFVTAARAHCREVHLDGVSGGQLVELWTRLVDQIVAALYTVLAHELDLHTEGQGLFAMGGYGRGELSPHSDLDLLVLHPGGDGIGPLVEGLLYPLWDAGLDVQCVARTLTENLDVARADARSRTSLLDARFLAGDPAAAHRYEVEILYGEIFSQGVKGFVEAKLAEMEARHQRYGDTVYVLEPNLKEGDGGLRDIQTALWVAKVRFKVRSVGELLLKGVVPPGEIEALQESRDFLLRVRNHLHFLTGRREDRLTFEFQDECAPFFGFEGEGPFPGVERFLQHIYACANQVHHFARTVVRRAAAGLLGPAGQRRRPREVAPGVRVRGSEVYLSPSTVRDAPRALLAAFEAAQVHDAELSPQALEVVRDHLHLVDDRFRRDPEAIRMFLKILRNPRRVATTLFRMHDVRFLDRFIPEFGRIFGRVQRDLYHRYPVDVHSLFAVQELRRLARGEYEEEFPLLTDLIRDLVRPDILYLAALLHDVGKGEGHDHAERGAEIATRVGDRMGLEPQDLEYLVFLVGNHLLLSHTAQGRDLHDEELIADFVRRVGELEALKMLYLLTFADIRAVGPGAWTSWKNLLFRELYEKAAWVLERGAPDRDLRQERVQGVRDRVRSAAAGRVPPEDVSAFLEHVEHDQYLLANPLEALLRHLDAFHRRSDAPVVERRPVPEEDYVEVLLVARDQPGLFASVAGLMAAHRLNILSAVLNTRTDGWVADVFHVSGPPGEVLGTGERWERWLRDLRGVLRGEVSLEAAVGTRLLRRSGLARPRPRIPTRIRVDNQASRRFTVLDLTAADRLGLLYDVARTLTAQGLTIHLAKIATNIEQVADSFYVEAVSGGKLTDADRLARLEAALETVIAQEGPAEEGP